MTAHQIDNMVSRFPESLSHAQISEINEKAIPINTKIGLGVFQGKILFLNIILHLNFTREAEIVITWNNCQLLSLFTSFKIHNKNIKIVIFYITDSLTPLVHANVTIHLSVGEKPSIFTSTSVNNCSLVTSTSENSHWSDTKQIIIQTSK